MGLRLYERGKELRMVSDLLRSAAASHGGSLFFAADAGLGKTALLRQISRDAAQGFRVGAASGDPLETSVAFSFLEQAGYELGCPVSLAADPIPGARSTQFYRVLHWLREVSEPTLLTLDDLHWADGDSIAMLSFLCRRLGGLPVAVVATLRPWPPAAFDVARRLRAAGYVGLTDLAPLSSEAAELVISSQARGQADAAAIKRAITLCGGNPMLLEQLSVLIGAGDDLSAPRLSRRLPDAQPLLLSRLAALPEDVIGCARAASVLGARFRPWLAAHVARVPEENIERTLDALVRSGLVREVRDHMAEFTHPIFGQLLHDDLGGAVRRQLHYRACRVLLDHGLEREAAQHAMRADIPGDPVAIEVLERVGLQTLRGGAVGPAIDQLRAAVTLAGHRASRTALKGLGEALLTAGQFREAISCCERLISMPGAQPRELAEEMLMRAVGLAQSGRLGEACDYLEEAVTAGHDAELAVDARTEHGYYRWWLSGPGAALPVLTGAVEMAGAAEMAGHLSDRRRSRAAALWGFAALQAGDPAGFTEVTAASRDVLAAPMAHLRDFSTRWGTLASFAVSAMLTEHFAEAEHAYTVAFGAAEQSGASMTAGILGLSVSYAALLLRLGRLNEALRQTSKVLRLPDLMPPLALTASVIHAEILLYLGRLDETEEWLSRAEALPAFRAAWEPALRLAGIRGHYQLRAGNWETASTHFLRAEELAEHAGVREPCLSMQARRAVMAHLHADRRWDAERVLGKLETAAARLPCRWPRIAALSARAGMAELAGDSQAADAAYAEALELHTGLALPLERIETLLEFGTLLRRRGALAKARPLLAEAVGAAEAIGAGWLAGQAHQELVASGGRRRRRGDVAGRLTPQERRVLALAAQGLSNEAIAGRLLVSAGTIKTHLEHIYAKLGVHSRRELILRRNDLTLSVCRTRFARRKLSAGLQMVRSAVFGKVMGMLDDSLCDAPEALKASRISGLDSARIPVRVWARDPISLAGLTSALVCRPELRVVDPGSGQARVALVAAESLDETVLSQLRTIRAQGCARTVLVITVLTDDDVLAAVDAGVSAIVWRREATATWLSEVVVKVAAGQPALPADVLSRLLKQIGRLNRQVLSPRGITLNGLSAREIEVLRLAADGLDTEEIAQRLSYSPRTVTNVFHDITCRFHLRNRTHAVAYAIREGLI